MTEEDSKRMKAFCNIHKELKYYEVASHKDYNTGRESFKSCIRCYNDFLKTMEVQIMPL
jgi:hypothetical protein